MSKPLAKILTIILGGLMILVIVVCFWLVQRLDTLQKNLPSRAEKTTITDATEIVSSSRSLVLIADDPWFARGFSATSSTWPVAAEMDKEKNAREPLCKLRANYCYRVGYSYADFSCDCFALQYYNAFDTYTNKTEFFSVYYPQVWDEDKFPVAYDFASTAHASFTRRGASCALTYGKIDPKIFTLSNISVTSTSWDDREWQKIEVPWGPELSNEQKASGYLPLKAVVIEYFPYATSPAGWVLTSGEHQPLVQACVDEFDSILRSLDVHFLHTKLLPDSNGSVGLRHIGSDYVKETPSRTALIFQNAATGREEEIVAAGLAGTRYISNSFFTHDKLYFLTDTTPSSVIKMVDIFSGAHKIVPLPYGRDHAVHSFTILDDWLYYLAGEYCNDYMQACNLNLYRQSLVSETHEKLASGFASRHVMGPNAAGDTLFFEHAEGDAGCAWFEFESYNVKTAARQKLGEYSYCYDFETDEPDNKAAYEQAEKMQMAATGVVSTDRLLIKNGRVFLPTSTAPTDEMIQLPRGEFAKIK